jgi:pRiA4b ORF-3-like protein
MTADAIARLKITLNDVIPPVLRRIELPLTIRLDRLHLVLQAAIGWTNSHLYELRAGDVGWGIPDSSWGDGPLDARKARLSDVLQAVGTKTLRSLYDFGDGWDHTIKIEHIDRAVPGTVYPRLIEPSVAVHPTTSVDPGAMRSSWPLAPIPTMSAMPSSPSGWTSRASTPKFVDLDAHVRAVAALAKQWPRKPAVKRKGTSKK